MKTIIKISIFCLTSVLILVVADFVTYLRDNNKNVKLINSAFVVFFKGKLADTVFVDSTTCKFIKSDEIKKEMKIVNVINSIPEFTRESSFEVLHGRPIIHYEFIYNWKLIRNVNTGVYWNAKSALGQNNLFLYLFGKWYLIKVSNQIIS
jgi:hypothetical protein